VKHEKHAVLIRVPLSDNDLGTAEDDALVDCLEIAIRTTLEREPRVGMWDGHEFGAGWAVIFCYGSDPSVLLDRVTEALLPLELPRAITVATQTKPSDRFDNMILSRLDPPPTQGSGH
jgi:hypothetical protein